MKNGIHDMKKLLLISLLASTLNATFIHKDKANHVALGLISYGGCTAIGYLFKWEKYLNSKTCVLAPIGVGAVKEAYDATGRGNVEWDDFTSTAIAPLMISYTIHF